MSATVSGKPAVKKAASKGAEDCRTKQALRKAALKKEAKAAVTT